MKKDEVEALDQETLEKISEPDFKFEEPKKIAKRGVGRPNTRKKDFPQFTEINRLRVLQHTSYGTPPKHAANLAGIGQSTLEDWLEMGKICTEKRARGEDLSPVEDDFADFYLEYNRLASTPIAALLGSLVKEAKNKPYLALKLLEKLDPENFGQKQAIEMTGKVGHAHIHGHIGLPDGDDTAKSLSSDDLRKYLDAVDMQKEEQKQIESGDVIDAEVIDDEEAD
jgi:hypothetical protein